MKIATWNVERPRSSGSRNSKILEELKRIDADILVLTETNSAIHPGEEYSSFSTDPLFETSEGDGVQYKQGENRVTVWTRYPALRSIKTCNSFSAVCVGVKTPFGELNVYGTVIGYRGNRHKAFKSDLDAQLTDWKTLSRSGHLCIAGDYNISFSDNYYFTKSGRTKLDECFGESKMELLTREIKENIDHIAISKTFLKGMHSVSDVWNRPKDKKLSDHIGVYVTL